MTQQIEPCPNCKMPATRGDEEAADHATEYSPVGYHMRFFCCCVQCGMKGPIEDLPELADGNWNRIARAVREAGQLRIGNQILTDAVSRNGARAEKVEAERDALRLALSRWLPPDDIKHGICRSCGMTFSDFSQTDWNDPSNHHMDCRWAVAVRLIRQTAP